MPRCLIVNVCLCYVLLFQPDLSHGLDECKKTGPCSCTNSEGTIDLSPLAGSGSAKFSDLGGFGAPWKYSYNPCTSFSEGTCNNVAVCQISTDGQYYYDLGTQDSVKFHTDPTTGAIQIVYTGITQGVTRTSTVTLTCDKTEEGSLAVKGETTPGSAEFMFTLTSKYACPGSGHIDVYVGISVGSVLCIVFFSVLFVYLVGGVSFQTFVRKSSGKEMLPNYNVWSTLPGLIRDGVLFTVKCGKSGNYDKI